MAIAAGRSRGTRLVLRIVLYGGAVFLGLPGAFSYVMTRTHAVPVSAQPAPGYTQVHLLSDGLELRAWLAQGEPDRSAVVIVHGLGDTLESYQEHARPFLERGHTVLLPDLRGHGASEGRHTTLGGRESEDVRAAIRYLDAEGLAKDGVVLMGHSMGAVAVLLAAADRDDVRAVVVEAPYDTYRNTVSHHAKLLYGLPSWVPIIPLSIRAAEWRAGFDADDIDAVDAASRIDAPLLAIVDGEDERMPEPVVSRIVDAHAGPHELWVAAGVDHVGAILHSDWEEVVLGFLAEHRVVNP
jgi:pimeloyl-ACP methyl ester carboxylesterase